MDNCSSVRELLPAFLDDELTPTQQEAVERHLSGCPGCLTEMEGLEKDTVLLRATIGAPVAVSDTLTDAVWARIEAEDREQARAARPEPRDHAAPKRSWADAIRDRLAVRFPAGQWAFAGGAVAAAVMLLTFTLTRTRTVGPTDVRVASVLGNPLWRATEASPWEPLTAGLVLHPGDLLKTDADDQVTTTWKDGSRAVLYPGGEEKVLDRPGVELKRGRLWAKVKRQPKSAPFTVRGPQGTVQTTGTEFSVDVPARGNRTTLVMVDGVGQLITPNGTATAGSWTQTTVVNGSAPTTPVPVSPLSRTSMWWVK